jgi:hypothetical protein
MSQDLSQALATARRALAILEKQAAGYTSLDIPAHLQIELEEKRAEVAKLEARLRGAGAPDNAPASGGGDHTHVEGGMFMGPVTVRGDMAGRDIIDQHVKTQYNAGSIHVNINLPQKEEPAISRGTPEWDAAIEHYRQRIREHYGATRVLGKHEPVSLEGIYTDVYLLNEPRAAIRGETRGKRLEGEGSVLKNYDPEHPNRHRFVILGKPGGGKTTFLKHIALSVDCPIFITLREWARSGLDLRAFIAEEMAICGLNDIIAETWLREGTAVLLLDGLDEISEKAQRRLDLDRFILRYPKCRILVMCRVAATPYHSEHFNYVKVADFTDEQVEAFAESWFGDGSSSNFCAEIKQNPHIRDLSRTPLLLGMLCLTYEKQGAFPEKRAELYQRALDTLLVEWDESRGIERDAMRRAEIYHELSLGRKHQMFARIAYETFEQGETLIPQAHLEQRLLDYLVTVPDVPERIDIDAKAVLNAIEAQHGILIEFSPRVYAFSHPTFQEYYAARYVVEQDEAGDEQAIPRLLSHAHEDRWREAILLVASTFSNADTFIRAFLTTLNNLVKDNSKLLNLLSEVTFKEKETTSHYKPLALRSLYIYLNSDDNNARYITGALDCDLLDNRLDDFYEIIAKAPAEDREMEKAWEYYDGYRGDDLGYYFFRDRGLEFKGQLYSALNFIVDLTNNLPQNDWCCLFLLTLTAKVFSCEVVCRWCFSKCVSIFKDVVKFSRMLPSSRVYFALSGLKFPEAGSSSETWQDFITQIGKAESMCVKPDWQFTDKDLQVLEYYLKASGLLVTCLDVANVTDREAIEDRLLLPPNYTQE